MAPAKLAAGFIIYWWRVCFVYHLFGLIWSEENCKLNVESVFEKNNPWTMLEVKLATIILWSHHNLTFIERGASVALDFLDRVRFASSGVVTNAQKYWTLFNMLQSKPTVAQKECEVEFQNASRLSDLERQRRANRCAQQGRYIIDTNIACLFLILYIF